MTAEEELEPAELVGWYRMVVGGWYGKGLVPVGTILVGGLEVCAGALVRETL